MTFTATFNPHTFKDALRKVQSVTDSGRRALPVAKHVLLEVVPSGVQMTATDFDATVHLTVPAETTGAGQALLPTKKLADIAAHLPTSGMQTSLVKLAVDGTTATITTGRASFEIAGLPPEDFPAFDAIDAPTHTVNGKRWLDGLTRCAAHAAPPAHETARPVMCSVCIEDGRLVATTGNRLCTLSSENIGGPYLLHAASIPALARVFGALKDDAPLTITAEAHRIAVSSEDATVVIRLVEGPYPNCQPLLRQTARHTIACDRDALSAAIKRVAIASGENKGIDFTATDDLTVTSASEGGKGLDIVEANVLGSPITWRLQSTAILAGLATFTGERIMLTLESPERGTFLRDPDLYVDLSPLVIVMPLRIP